MLLVGTQPLRSQHPPLTPLPLGSAIPPQAENKPPGKKGERGHTDEALAGEMTGGCIYRFQPDVRLGDEV